MKKNVRIWYDKEGDYFELTVGEPVKGHFRPIGNECFERVSDKSGRVIGLAIFGFSKRFKSHRDLRIPVEMALKGIKAH
jgi:hypothetical protein